MTPLVAPTPQDPRNGVIRGVFAWDALGWGLVLIQPGSTFALGHSYDGLASVMGEDGWAVCFFLGAMLILLSFPARGWLRLSLTFGIGFSHTLLAWTFARSTGLLSTGTVTHVGLTVLAYWLLGQDWTRRRA